MTKGRGQATGWTQCTVILSLSALTLLVQWLTLCQCQLSSKVYSHWWWQVCCGSLLPNNCRQFDLHLLTTDHITESLSHDGGTSQFVEKSIMSINTSPYQQLHRNVINERTFTGKQYKNLTQFGHVSWSDFRNQSQILVKFIQAQLQVVRSVTQMKLFSDCLWEIISRLHKHFVL